MTFRLTVEQGYRNLRTVNGGLTQVGIATENNVEGFPPAARVAFGSTKVFQHLVAKHGFEEVHRLARRVQARTLHGFREAFGEIDYTQDTFLTKSVYTPHVLSYFLYLPVCADGPD